MQKEVGETAGKIYQALREGKTVSISRVPTMIGAKMVVSYQAIGWLAREGKIKYSSKGKNTYVSLP